VAIDVRKGMPSTKLDRATFEARIRRRLADPAFDPLQSDIARLIEAAWEGYSNSRKSPRTEKAGPGHADPDYDLAVDWIAARRAIEAAQRRHDDASAQKRVLLINGSARSDQTCPSEMSKSYRLCKLAEAMLLEQGLAVDFLDLSRLVSELGRNIHPCKACVSTAMPLCHWPCSCYPNYSLQQTDDWMNEIYPMWVEAHGIMIVTPVYWYQAPAGLKAMIDRLVCADGGNPDPSSTHGKVAEEAKAIELAGWDYPKHLAGRLFALVVHGDAVGAEGLRRGLEDWLTDMDLIPAGSMAIKDGYIGYDEPYATAHRELDADEAFQDDVRTAARTLARAIKLQAQWRLTQPDDDLQPAILK
jgi:multimeric flavodoxin WrbA